MKSVSKQALKAFKEWGRKGGQKRAWKLSASKRQSISRHAAQMRWGWKEEERNPMSSVRLRRPLWENPVYLEEVLLFGGESFTVLLEIVHSVRRLGLSKKCLKPPPFTEPPFYGKEFLKIFRETSYEKKEK